MEPVAEEFVIVTIDEANESLTDYARLSTIDRARDAFFAKKQSIETTLAVVCDAKISINDIVRAVTSITKVAVDTALSF